MFIMTPEVLDLHDEEIMTWYLCNTDEAEWYKLVNQLPGCVTDKNWTAAVWTFALYNFSSY